MRYQPHMWEATGLLAKAGNPTDIGLSDAYTWLFRHYVTPMEVGRFSPTEIYRAIKSDQSLTSNHNKEIA